MKALRVDVCGTDGAGKTTGLKYLVQKLQSMGDQVLETREVGNPFIPTAVKLREMCTAIAANARTFETIEYADPGQALTDLRYPLCSLPLRGQRPAS